MADAKKYQRTKLILGIAQTLMSLVLLFLFVTSGISRSLYSFVSIPVESIYLRFLSFVLATGVISGLIFFPFTFYGGYLLEHRYGLSNQDFMQWLALHFKNTAVSGIILLPLGLIFYFLLNFSGDMWWVWLAVVMLFFSLLLSVLFPVLIFPLFYKQSPLDNPELQAEIEQLAKTTGLHIRSVNKFDMSKTTKKGNAMFTGLGRSKRILLGDTIMETFTGKEILTIIAHELGHYRHRHIIKNVIISTGNSFLLFGLSSVLYKTILLRFGFNAITDIPALPLLVVVLSVIGILQSPVFSAISRRFEYQADDFAIRQTGEAESFISSLEKLNTQNLGDPDPHPFIEWFSYSHPSVKNRIKAIRKIETAV